MERRHILVSGRVQGVWFRASTMAQAEAIGLVGWVRNLPDSRVEIVAEGSAESLGELIQWCWKGPSFARVTDVEVSSPEASGEFSEFGVR